jgi:hypothetical protein
MVPQHEIDGLKKMAWTYSQDHIRILNLLYMMKVVPKNCWINVGGNYISYDTSENKYRVRILTLEEDKIQLFEKGTEAIDFALLHARLYYSEEISNLKEEKDNANY